MKLFSKFIEDLQWGFFVPNSDKLIKRSMASPARAYTILVVILVVAAGALYFFGPIRGVNLPVRVSPSASEYRDELNLAVYPPTLVRQIESLDWEGQYRETFITTKGIVYRWKDGPKVIEQVLLKPNVCTQINGVQVFLTITSDQYITTSCP